MKKKIIIIILSVICLLCIGLLLTPTTEAIWQIEAKPEETEDQIFTGNSDIISKYQIQYNNTDIVAELEIPNTDTKTPVLIGKDNEFYLKHLPNKQESYLGSIFLDYRNNLNDRKIIIYGHNSQSIDTIFHGLEEYTSYAYYKTHQDLYLQTEIQKYHYKIFSVYIATNNLSHVNLNLTNSEYIKHLQQIKEQSLYDTGISVESEDIIILQTCFYNPQNSYLIIAAKKINL